MENTKALNAVFKLFDLPEDTDLLSLIDRKISFCIVTGSFSDRKVYGVKILSLEFDPEADIERGINILKIYISNPMLNIQGELHQSFLVFNYKNGALDSNYGEHLTGDKGRITPVKILKLF